MKNTLSYVLVWLTAVVIASALATLAPNDRSVMGRVPAIKTPGIVRMPASAPHPLAAERTLVLITFLPAHRVQADSWVEGLGLNENSSINWLRMPVLNDPGTSKDRVAAENRLRQRYPADAERERLFPLFTDRTDFVRNAGLNGADQFYALVLNREGDVLARVAGDFDAKKAKALRETLDEGHAGGFAF
jgi:hypothetical protein